MAEVYVFSQRQFNKVMNDMGWNDSNIERINDAAIISICNTDGSMEHWFKEDHDNVLNVEFDDDEHSAPGAKIKVMSPRQAKAVVDFYEQHINARYFVVHCEAGISRSAAVAQCFIDFLKMHSVKDVTLHENFAFCPNAHIERMLHRELYRRN